MPNNPVHRSPVSAKHSFDDRSGRYRNNKTGKFVPQKTIARALDYQIKKSAASMQSVTRNLMDKKIGVAEWRGQMVKHIKTIHIAQYAAGQGGWGRMTQADYGRIGGILKKQYSYLNGFANDLQANPPDGRALVRAGLYASAANATYAASQKMERHEAGMSKERRVLDNGAENCTDCIEWAERGWVPIFSSPPIGSSKCKVNCRCTMEFSDEDDPPD